LGGKGIAAEVHDVEGDVERVEELDSLQEIDGGTAEAIELDDDQVADIAGLETLLELATARPLPDGDAAGNVVIVEFGVGSELEFFEGEVFLAADFLCAGFLQRG
jgi:hypothetical protein